MTLHRKCCCTDSCAGSGACCIKIDTNTYFPCYGTCVITRLDTTPPTVYSTTDFGTSFQCQLPPDWRDGNGNQLGDCICYTENYPPQSIGLTLDADCTAMIGQSIDVGIGGDQNVVSVNWDDNEFMYTAQWTAHAAEPSGIYYKNCFPPQRSLECSCQDTALDDINKCDCEALNGTAVGRTALWIPNGTCDASCFGCTCERGDCLAIAGGAHVESECAYILRKKTRSTTWTRGSDCSECTTGEGDTDVYHYKIATVSGYETSTLMNNCTYETGMSFGCVTQASKITSHVYSTTTTNLVVGENVELIGSTVSGVYTENAAGVAAMAAWVALMQSTYNASINSPATSCQYKPYTVGGNYTVDFIQQFYDCPIGCDCFNDTFFTYTYIGVDPVTGSDVYCPTNILYPITSTTGSVSGAYYNQGGSPISFSGSETRTYNMSEQGYAGCGGGSYCYTGACCPSGTCGC